MKWYEVTLVSTHEGADLFADALFSVGCGGVSIYDKQDIVALYDSDIVWDYIDENLVNNLDDRVFVKGIIGEEEKTEVLQKIAEEIENLKKNSPFNLGSGEIIVNSIDDEDWKNEWKKYYKPIVTKSVTVVPVWIKYNKISDKEKILWINPGMAFGTGEHETTKMCLDLLGEIDVSAKPLSTSGRAAVSLESRRYFQTRKARICATSTAPQSTLPKKTQGSITCPTDVKSSAPTFWKRAKNPPTSFLQTLRRTFS